MWRRIFFAPRRDGAQATPDAPLLHYGAPACYVDAMTLIDAVTWMQQRPGFCAVLGDGPIVGLSSSGYLMRRDKPLKTYWRPTAGQVLAITWEVYTADQLAAAADAAAKAVQVAAPEISRNG